MWSLFEAQAEALGEAQELRELRALVEKLQAAVTTKELAELKGRMWRSEVPALMTTKELAELLNVKPDRIYELVARGKLKPTRVGRQLRFTRDAIEQFLAQ